MRAGKLLKTEIAHKFGMARSTLSGIVKDEARVTAALNGGELVPNGNECVQWRTIAS